MNILFFDIETNGKLQDWSAPPAFHNKYPRIIDIAWMLSDSAEHIISGGSFLIKPDGWEIPKEEFFITSGYSTELSLDGLPIDFVLGKFTTALLASDLQVGHNIVFDKKVIQAEYHRMRPGPLLDFPNTFCTMQKSRSLVDARSQDGRKKPPKLEELYRFLFNTEMRNAHRAAGDVLATKECFYEMLRRQLITI